MSNNAQRLSVDALLIKCLTSFNEVLRIAVLAQKFSLFTKESIMCFKPYIMFSKPFLMATLCFSFGEKRRTLSDFFGTLVDLSMMFIHPMIMFSSIMSE